MTLVQGDHLVVGSPGVVLTTVLGSCIAVCLHDPVAKVGGMNHFLLPQPAASAAATPAAQLQRYGIHAMELLINAVMAHGGERGRLKAHCYGGGNVVAGLGGIGDQNVAFARRFLITEGIPIVHEDVGGRIARRVEFLPREGRSRCIRVAEAPPLQPLMKVALDAPVGELELF